MDANAIIGFSARRGETPAPVIEASIYCPEVHPLAELHGSLEALAGIGTWRYAFRTQHLAWSPGLFRLLGLDDASVRPSYDLFARFVHPDDQLPTDNLDWYLREVRFIDRVLRVVRVDGSIRWLSHKAEVLLDADQEPCFAIGIMLDVTDGIVARDERDAAEARLRTLTRTTQCFTWIVHADGYKPPSQGWMDLRGQTAAEATGLGWLDVIHPDDRERTKKAFLHSRETQTPYAAKYRLMCRDGVTRWFLSRCAPIFDEAGTLVEWFGVAFDISDVNSASAPRHGVGGDGEAPGPLVKASRALLDWSIEDLAQRSGVSISSIRRIESENGAVVRNNTSDRLMKTLKSAGIELYRIDTQGTFLRLRAPA
jgi:PAS domain S-box-containing protein